MLTEMTWVIAAALIVSMLLAIVLGANDVGNFFGTSVGANILTMKSAFFLATVSEISGAVLLGEKVSDTIWKSIIDYRVFHDQEKCLMLGNLSALIGCSIWMTIATRFRLPVSATHSIVGATVGYAMVVHGSKGVNWIVFLTILGSWLVSPVLAGVLSLLLLHIVRKFLSRTKEPAAVVLRWLPFTCAITVMINVFSILMFGPNTRLSVLYLLIITGTLGFLVALAVWFLMVPRLKKSVDRLEKQGCVDDSLSDLYNSPLLESSTQVDCQSKVKEFILNYLETPSLDAQSDDTFTKNQSFMIRGEKMNSRAIQVFLPQDVSTQLSGVVRLSTSGNYPRIHSDSNIQPNSVILRKSKSCLPTLNDPYAEYTCLIDRQIRNTYTNNYSSDYINDSSQIHGLDDYVDNDADNYDSTFNHIIDHSRNEMDDDDSSSSTSLSFSVKPVLYDSPSLAKIFSVLQIMSALFGSFTHGFNDVSNAIAPLVAAWMLWVTEYNLMSAKTPLWILLYGGTFISVGIWLWGDRTIKTIGQDITSICPSSGFIIELCSAVAVLIASNLGLPVSSTHCKVGSVVCVGRMSGKDAVNWILVRNIVIAWAATFPVTGIISAFVMIVLRKLVPT